MTSLSPWEVQANGQAARSRTAKLERDLTEILSILRVSLQRPPLRWEDLSEEVSFDIPQPQKPGDPEKTIKPPYPPAPDPIKFVPELDSFDKLVRSRGDKKKAEAAARLETAEAAWREKCAEIDAAFDAAVAFRENLHQGEVNKYNKAVSEWEAARKEHFAKQNEQREKIEGTRSDYKAGKASAVENFFAGLLARSAYPEGVPKKNVMSFDGDSGVLVVDFELPAQSALPKIKEVQYIVSRDEFLEIPLSETWQRKTYDEALYQIALRTIHELYAADEGQVIKSVVFNGTVKQVDKATGGDTCDCVLSVQANREEFLQIHLNQVDPKACFQKLNGRAGANLYELTAIEPIATINKKRAGS